MHEPSDTRDLSILEEMGYEHEDLQLDAAPKATVWFFVGVIISIILGGVIFFLISPDSVAFQRTQAYKEFRRMPEAPAPLLQTNKSSHEDIRNLKTSENETLHSFGWVDKAKGVAHVPVEEAMDMTLEEGLPTRANAKELTFTK